MFLCSFVCWFAFKSEKRLQNFAILLFFSSSDASPPVPRPRSSSSRSADDVSNDAHVTNGSNRLSADLDNYAQVRNALYELVKTRIVFCIQGKNVICMAPEEIQDVLMLCRFTRSFFRLSRNLFSTKNSGYVSLKLTDVRDEIQNKGIFGFKSLSFFLFVKNLFTIFQTSFQGSSKEYFLLLVFFANYYFTSLTDTWLTLTLSTNTA